MKTLESCYEVDFSKINFIERKVKIDSNKTILLGPPKSGKSYLIYDFLSNLENEEYLYIDFSDIRNDKDEIKTNIKEFIKEHSITTLALDNFDFSFDFPSTLENIIITTNKNIYLEDFTKLLVMPLDFEEYLLHDMKHQNITSSFNFFLKYGNLPQTLHIEESKKIIETQNTLKLFTKDYIELEILKLLFKSIDEKQSIYQLFTSLKKREKISKDKFYETCKYYEDNKVVFFVQKYKQPRSTKKVYAYNHAFLNIISHEKKFKNEFSNMVFLELIKNYDEIYYLENCDFYIEKENLCVFNIPFFNDFLMPQVTKKIYNLKKEVKVDSILILTIGNEKEFFIDDIECNALPFYEWSLS